MTSVGFYYAFLVVKYKTVYIRNIHSLYIVSMSNIFHIDIYQHFLIYNESDKLLPSRTTTSISKNDQCLSNVLMEHIFSKETCHTITSTNYVLLFSNLLFWNEIASC